jgi:hypothetical protein
MRTPSRPSRHPYGIWGGGPGRRRWRRLRWTAAVSREAIWEELAPGERVSGATIGGWRRWEDMREKPKKGGVRQTHQGECKREAAVIVVDPVAQPWSGLDGGGGGSGGEDDGEVSPGDGCAGV